AVLALALHLDRPLASDSVRSTTLHQIVSKLVYPHGVASLAQEERFFHPYHHDQIYHYDAAYHNGMCWHWMAGPVLSALVDQGHIEQAFCLSKNLADQILEMDMPGSLSELVEPLPDANGHVRMSGTYSQAWSVSEFARVFYQDYLGLRPLWLDRTLVIRPALPSALSPTRFEAVYGENEKIAGLLSSGKKNSLRLAAITLHAPVQVRLQPRDKDNRIYEFSCELEPYGEHFIQWRFHPAAKIRIDKGAWLPLGEPVRVGPGGLTPAFQTPCLPDDLPALNQPDALERLLLRTKTF
ncbi:hypothetical protein JW992_07745, partial [candidate division KSB1 bacterium]|nr:hypothetical protein [candidate division KSB1 bacterium]